MTLSQRSSHQLVEFLTAVSDHQDADGATAVAARLAAEQFDADVGAVLIGDALAAAVGFGMAPAPAGELVHACAAGARRARGRPAPRARARRAGAQRQPVGAAAARRPAGQLLSGDEDTAERLRRLKTLGVSIAVDDFGTGYSSLSYLKQFPVDALKIDKSFVDAVASSTEDSALARTIVELGRGMRLDTIAEGIENLEQLEQLRMLDCQLGQGYHFSHPLSGAQLTAYLQETLDDERRAA